MMEYQEIINFLDNTSNQPSKFRKNGLKYVIKHKIEGMKLVMILNLKLQCQNQVYVITVMYTYLLKEQ